MSCACIISSFPLLFRLAGIAASLVHSLQWTAALLGRRDNGPACSVPALVCSVQCSNPATEEVSAAQPGNRQPRGSSASPINGNCSATVGDNCIQPKPRSCRGCPADYVGAGGYLKAVQSCCDNVSTQARTAANQQNTAANTAMEGRPDDKMVSASVLQRWPDRPLLFLACCTPPQPPGFRLIRAVRQPAVPASHRAQGCWDPAGWVAGPGLSAGRVSED